MIRRAVIGVCCLVWACVPACGDDTVVNPNVDAAARDAAAYPIDAAPLADRVDPLLWVELSASGCESGGVDDEPCTGRAPLTLTFAATAPAAIDTFVWSFGDGSPSAGEASPVHSYELPGSYDVSLTVGGPGGTASAVREGFVVVAPAELGDPCDLDAQCDAALECVCGDDAECPPGLAAGVCTATCSDVVACPDSGLCADLDPADAADADWTRPLCLTACEDDGQCRGDMRCRELRSGADGSWVNACFAPGLLSDLGGSCSLPGGGLDDASCTSGLCADEGARGMCTADCATDPCPSYAACATFAAGSRCLARCSMTFACDDDPWLACEAPGGAGSKSFTVDETPADDGYCAPKSCTEAAECGPDGACVDGFCTGA